jgi:predicted HTH domain antitoxin
MNLELPDDIMRRAEASQLDVRVALAVQLYADNRLDYDDARRLADVCEAVFNRELLTRKISVQKYPPRRRSAS